MNFKGQGVCWHGVLEMRRVTGSCHLVVIDRAHGFELGGLAR